MEKNLTPVDDRPTTSTGTPAVNLFNWSSSIFSSVFTLAVCPLMPLTRPFNDVCSAVCDRLGACFVFFPGGCFPLLLPETGPLLMMREAKGLSSSSSSSLLFISASLKDDEDARRLLVTCGGKSLNIEELGDSAPLDGF